MTEDLSPTSAGPEPEEEPVDGTVAEDEPTVVAPVADEPAPEPAAAEAEPEPDVHSGPEPVAPPIPEPEPEPEAPSFADAGAPPQPSFDPPAGAAPADRPEVAVGAAFAGGFAFALLLKRLGRRKK